MFICQNVLLHVHCTCIIMKHFFTKLLNSFENIHPFDTGRCVLVTPWCCWWRNWSDQYKVSVAIERNSCDKEELWRKWINLVKKQHHLSIGGQWFSPCFSPFCCFVSKVILYWPGCPLPSHPFPEELHKPIILSWCSFDVNQKLFSGYIWRTSFGERKISKVCLTLALANFTMRTWTFAM